jgi:hypothetical protein
LTIILCVFTKTFAQIQFGTGSNFNYLKGSEAANLSADWYKPTFSAANWATGTAPFRYGKGNGGTLLADMKNSYSTLYLRTTFTAKSVDQIKKIKLSANFDDGFVIWINGQLLTSENAPASLKYNSLATTTHEFETAFSTQLQIEDLTIQEGENTIAVMVLNTTIGSSDIYFDMQLSALPELPRLETDGKITFSKEAGFYTDPFDLTLSTTATDCKIVYTVDGSNPATSSTATSVSSKTTLRIDPTSDTNRETTPAFVVKASLVKEGFAPTFPISKTYIFPEEVKSQVNPGGSWPEWQVNGQYLDFDMATDVVTNNAYKNQLVPALKEIPTISVSTDLNNLFGDSEGIYVNAAQKGEEWERECSVELINPNGQEGFQTNAGLRIRGGNSAKNSNNPKHGLRLFFRKDYGKSKLKYPLFGADGASEFECIDLRCEQNYSWSMDGSSNNTMLKDIYCRDLQGLMGQPHARGFQFHLYLNGMYWGIYQTDERPEASFAESYLGGDKEDYDVIKVNTMPWPYYDEVTDGNMDAWEELWNLCQNGFDTNEKYFNLEGKNSTGERVNNAPVWVDIDNLIDYMMIIFYSGNFDAPVSAWSSNDMPNNFFAIYNRKNKSQGFKFIAHDSEHCMFVDPANIDAGIDENRVNLGSSGAMKITDVLNFNPQWLHYKLCANAEYRLRFADRAYKYLSDGGLLSPEKAKALFQKRASEIDTAIVAESARWGDAQSWTGVSLTKNGEWMPELENMYNNYFPFRTNIVIDQLKDEKLYPTINAPVISANGEQVYADKFIIDGKTEVTISGNNATGEIFYSVDGTDPRSVDGALSSTALQGGNSTNITLSETTLVLARLKNGSDWGPLKQVCFTKGSEDFSNLKVTELQYHPLDEITTTDTTDDKSFEFIEFKNTGNTFIDLSGLKLDSAVTYTFPENTLLAPGKFYVVSSKTNAFYNRYGIYPSGNYQGQFSNSGEYVLLTDRDGKGIISFTYSDKLPWPIEADGLGNSLTSAEENPTGNPNESVYWKLSSKTNGTPFTDDDATVNVDRPEMNGAIADIAIYPNPVSDFLNIDIRSEGRDEATVSLIDISGRVVYNGSITGHKTIDLKELKLNPGLVFIRAEIGHRVVSKKLIYVP